MRNSDFLRRGSVIPFLAGLSCGVLGWSAWNALTPPAEAQTPKRPQPTLIGTFDAGKQRDLMLRELRTGNKQLTEIAKLLEELRNAQRKE
jgi:hypothetical protein